MGTLGENGWNDRLENYADGYTRNFTLSTADNVIVSGNWAQPAVVYSVTLTISQNGASGDFVLVDGSATADSGDTRKWRAIFASGAAVATNRDEVMLHATFPRGIVFNTGLIVSAATLTGACSISYKARF